MGNCTSCNKTIALNQMRNMSVDEIVNMYRNGYRLEEPEISRSLGTYLDQPKPKIQSLQVTTFGGFLALIGLGALIWALFIRK